MLTRICLIVAIIAGLAVGVLNFVKVKDKVVTLRTDLKTTQDNLAKTETTLRQTETKLSQTETSLKSTVKQLEIANNEKDRAVTEAQAADKRAQKATDALAEVRKALESAQAELGQYHNSGLTPEQAANANKQLKELQSTITGLQAENKVLGSNNRKLENELAIYRTPDWRPALPASLQGKVVISDPKWDFVVLNVGEDQGVLENGELLVNRNGKLIAKVIVRSVQKDRCIANVVAGWKLGEVVEGDSVIPAKPAAS